MVDDTDRWEDETSDVEPLGESAKNKAFLEAKPAPKPGPAARNNAQPPVVNVSVEHLRYLTAGDFSDIDAATVKKLKRGQLDIDAKIDLHGMTKEAADHALEQFIYRHIGARRKLLLVITGKGGLDAPGVLKSSLEGWLNAPALRPSIIAFSQAKPEHGGSGAFYVLLRKKGV